MAKKSYKIIVLGASGMLGHKMFEILSKDNECYGTVTSFAKYKEVFPKEYHSKIIDGVIADKIETVEKVVTQIKPDFVINCIGVIKQNEMSHDAKNMIQLNALFPHQLASICDSVKSKLITIATDCVFDGQKGEPYLESDLPTCHDAYGMSKYLGEINYGNHLTLRTSIIGHELGSSLSLLDWFLNEESEVIKGYTKAIFSGLPTFELASFIDKYVLDNKELKGLYHLSVEPISKFDLLKLVAKEYNKKVEFVTDDKVKINRALNSDKLRKLVGYQPSNWEDLIYNMHQDYLHSKFYNHKYE